MDIEKKIIISGFSALCFLVAGAMVSDINLKNEKERGVAAATVSEEFLKKMNPESPNAESASGEGSNYLSVEELNKVRAFDKYVGIETDRLNEIKKKEEAERAEQAKIDAEDEAARIEAKAMHWNAPFKWADSKTISDKIHNNKSFIVILLPDDRKDTNEDFIKAMKGYEGVLKSSKMEVLFVPQDENRNLDLAIRGKRRSSTGSLYREVGTPTLYMVHEGTLDKMLTYSGYDGDLPTIKDMRDFVRDGRAVIVEEKKERSEAQNEEETASGKRKYGKFGS